MLKSIPIKEKTPQVQSHRHLNSLV